MLTSSDEWATFFILPPFINEKDAISNAITPAIFYGNISSGNQIILNQLNYALITIANYLKFLIIL